MTRLLFPIFLCLGFSAQAKLNVITTTTDLQAVVKAVAGDQVDVIAIAKGTQDPHQIEAKPSYMVKMRNADLVIAHGLELESAWIVPLIQGSRNPKIAVGGKGYFELGDKIDPIEIPKGNVTRAEGDVHPGGNPHFALDPIRLGTAAGLIAEKLGDLDSSNRELFKKNADGFAARMQEKTKEWKARLEKTKIKDVITYHKTLSYFLERFGIQNSAQLEPRPGIPPTAAHLLDVIELMKKRDIRLILVENLYESSAADKIKQEIPSVRIARVPVYVGGDSGVETNEQLIARIVRSIEENAH